MNLNLTGLFLLGACFHLALKIKRSENDHRKIDPADLNSPRRELSNSGLGIIANLLVSRQIDFSCADS